MIRLVTVDRNGTKQETYCWLKYLRPQDGPGPDLDNDWDTLYEFLMRNPHNLRFLPQNAAIKHGHTGRHLELHDSPKRMPKLVTIGKIFHHYTDNKDTPLSTAIACHCTGDSDKHEGRDWVFTRALSRLYRGGVEFLWSDVDNGVLVYHYELTGCFDTKEA